MQERFQTFTLQIARIVRNIRRIKTGEMTAKELCDTCEEDKGVVWSGMDDSLLKKYVADSAQLWQGHTDSVPAYMIGSTIGTHVGPGAIGVAFFEK